MLTPYKDKVLTITVDNGKEFTLHKTIAKQLEADVYFAHPYCSWERGLNENTNGLIRQYHPKKSDFTNIQKQGYDVCSKSLKSKTQKVFKL